MEEHLIIDLAAVLVLGISGVWIAWRLRLPSILVLLILGFTAGPITGVMNTDHVFGELLLPAVSLSVGIILFEGGLSLKLRELREIGGPFLNLITLGVLLTWAATTILANTLGGLDLPLSILLGAILVVTGPTVIVPLLRDIRPSGRIGALLKWEGIVIDPVGASLAVLTFEAIFATEAVFSVAAASRVVITTIIAGGLLGLAGAAVVYLALRRYWVPDYLHNPFALTIVVAVFVGADLVQTEAGLLATTVMGVALTNQEHVPMKQLAEFKEDLQVILISSLFILLSSRLPLNILEEFTRLPSILFLLALILLVRPLSVILSTLGSRLDWRERAFLGWMAPRGIVAAAVSSIFAIRLAEVGHPGAERLTILAFVAVAGTVAVYGLTSPIVARRLGIADDDPGGFLIVGAHAWARRIAEALQKEDVRVLLMDSNYDHIREARMAGLETTYGSALAQSTLEELDLSGIGSMLALTPNAEVNSLAALHFREIFGREGVFQLAPPAVDRRDQHEGVSTHLRGRILFGSEWTYASFSERFEQPGTEVKITRLTENFLFQDWRDEHGDRGIPMFLVKAADGIEVFAEDEPPQAQPGDRVIGLVSSPEPLDRYT
ncbi:MAG: sodium:proton antiporter [Anaerolineales bacterium]|nr:sodium:proton antiporter [Anaerolineales bacterium]